MGMLTWINGRLSKRSFVSKLYISSQATLLAEATNNVGIYSLLKDSERSLLQEQRVLVKRARELTQAVGLSQAPYFSTSKLDESVFTVVIAGEFNSGKSTLINALVGSRLLEVGNLPTTDCITILSHQLQDDSHFPEQDQKHIPGVLRYSVNLPLLQDMNLVDTPGTNALTNHTARTLNLLPKADCILFVTSADRPLPESERKVIESIQQYRKNIIIVINKMDIIEASGGDHGHKEKQQIINFVATQASDLLGANPTVLAVSARDALAAKLTLPAKEHEQAAIWKRSNFVMLESFLRDTLTTETKLKSKLLNPLGVAEGWLTDCQTTLDKDVQALESDRMTSILLSSQMEGWQKELQADMDRARRTIGERMEQEGRRGHVLLGRLLSKLPDFYQATLLDPSLLSRAWSKTQPIVDKDDTIESALRTWVDETADAIATQSRAQGQAVIEYLGQQPSIRNKSLVGSVMTASKFTQTRENLSTNMGRAVQRCLLDDDLGMEEQRFLHGVKLLARVSAALQVSAVVSLGASALQLVEMGAGLGMATGLVASSAVVLYGRRSVSESYESKWRQRDLHLQEALRGVLHREYDRIQSDIQNGIIPYTRYVLSEQERTSRLTLELQDLYAETHQLRKKITNLGNE